VVKAVFEPSGDGRRGRALYFTRSTAPSGDGPLYHHIGLYAYRVDFLRRFPALSAGVLERLESLEQLRALEHGYTISVLQIDSHPGAGVDTHEDLERVRRILSTKDANSG
jgi:3-deoxy-manno-octulosonate cytidylyltransferase (CMP-KDO synthetase)